ncbi:MAG: hypothetical protein EOM80_12625 [Erysipelotrichia bacterium]|nr:hypothetical protein [Erysipelotrichia bacterium]
MISFFRSSSLLCRLKLRLLLCSLKNWASLGKTIGIALSVLISAVIIKESASDLIVALEALPYSGDLIEWLLAAITVYVVFIVFTGDLITGHTINTGQMSSDFSFLSALPISPLSLICVKLFERIISDYLGVLIIFSAFIGISCREVFSFQALLLSLLFFLQISLLIGLAINLCMIVLGRFCKTTTINNFFSMAGYLSAFLTLVPYLIASNFPVESVMWVFKNLDSLSPTLFKILLPAKWLTVSLLRGEFSAEFFKFSAFWGLCVTVGIGLFHAAIKLNWLSFSHSNSSGLVKPRRKFFRGLIQKEVVLLTSDFNLLINAILMPITLILLEVYFLRKAFTLSTSTSVLNIVYGSVMYFCAFGPLNTIGSEGKAISLLETLPLAPTEILWRKFVFWLVIAECLFMPATLAIFDFMSYTREVAFFAMLSTMLFTAGCVGVSVSLSAVFARFDSKIMQQRSSFVGKLAALGLMLIAVPIKSFSWLNLYSFIVFVCLTILVFIKAATAIFYRIDEQARQTAYQKRVETMLLLFAFVGIEVTIKHFFLAVVPGESTGIWSWLIAAILILPAAITLILSHNQIQPVAVPETRSKKLSDCLYCVVITSATTAAAFIIAYLKPFAMNAFCSDIRQVISVIERFGVAAAISQPLFLGFAIVSSAVVTLSVLNNLFLSSHDKNQYLYNTIAILLLALSVPSVTMEMALLAAVAMFALKHRGVADNRLILLLPTTLVTTLLGYYLFF